jgi:hypothetical protein
MALVYVSGHRAVVWPVGKLRVLLVLELVGSQWQVEFGWQVDWTGRLEMVNGLLGSDMLDRLGFVTTSRIVCCWAR